MISTWYQYHINMISIWYQYDINMLSISYQYETWGAGSSYWHKWHAIHIISYHFHDLISFSGMISHHIISYNWYLILTHITPYHISMAYNVYDNHIISDHINDCVTYYNIIFCFCRDALKEQFGKNQTRLDAWLWKVLCSKHDILAKKKKLRCKI